MAKGGSAKKAEAPTPWRPFIDLERWERDMERLIDEFFDRKARAWWPEPWSLPALPETQPPVLDCYEEKGDMVVKVELPGILKENIEINVADRMLTLKGEKSREEQVEAENYYRSERSFGSFSRSLELPKDVEANRVKAVLDHGVLEIRLPIAEAAKSKSIKVKVEEGPTSVGQD